MVKKLVIKNFGPIRAAEIDLKKINIFIGPQGSGKSTIAKIVSAVMSYMEKKGLGRSTEELKAKLVEDLNLSSFFEQGTRVTIKSVEGEEILVEKEEDLFYVKEDPAPYYSSFFNSIYIPAERTVIPLIAGSSFYFIREKTPIPKYITDFGLLFQKARADIKSQKFSFLDDITYHYRDGNDTIELKNGKIIALTDCSNGIQTTVPLLLAFSWLTTQVNNRANNKTINIAIEEPELSLFPFTQNDLLKFIFQKIALLNYHLTITTHSPYTLTAINNLIYAYQVGTQKEEVKDIVPMELWLNPEDVGAWYVDNGTVHTIMDFETNQIKAEAIDKISEELNKEYDKIMDVKFK